MDATMTENIQQLPPAALPEPTTMEVIPEEGEEGEEEGEYPEESFANVSELRAHGVQAADIAKLTRSGFTTVGLVATATTRELANIKGLSAERVKFIREKSLVVDPSSSAFFRSGLEVRQLREETPKITTGSAALDMLLGGGIESGTITEIFGESGTGKTQLALALCVKAQLDKADGGAAGRVLYIDTDDTFRTERLVQIAIASGVDPEQCLYNVKSTRACNFEMQCAALKGAALELAEPSEGEYRLVIIDCVMSHLRAEYAGRGELSERQQTLNAHLCELKKFAQAFKVAVVVTNQVMAVPDQFSLGGPQVKSCGGPIMAHNTNTKVFLKKAGRGQKKAVLQHSPFMPYGDCVFSITKDGIVDAVDA